MGLNDLFMTPIVLAFILGTHRMLASKLSNPNYQQFYKYGLYLKLFGAVAFVLIFLFYYGGGDTTFYHDNSSVIYRAFWNDPLAAIRSLTLSAGEYTPGTYEVTKKVIVFGAAREWNIVRWGGIFSLFTFNSYLSITLLFSTVSFYGLWFLFLALSDMYPRIYKSFGYAIFYFPSMFFWSSSYLKEPICILGLGLMFWAFYKILVKKESIIIASAVFLFGFLITMQLKPYIPLSFLPAAFFWVFTENVVRIRSPFLRIAAAPILITVAVVGGYVVITRLTAGDSHFDINDFPRRVKISADYLYRISLQQGGSAYTLGELDGTWGSTLRLAPNAVIVSLFRPFLWEARNPVMLLAALEASFVVGYTLYTLVHSGIFYTIGKIIKHPFLQLCLVFSVVFAFAIGISTFNFGSLVRYKIPIYPFFLSMLFVINFMKDDEKERSYEVEQENDLVPEKQPFSPADFTPVLKM